MCKNCGLCCASTWETDRYISVCRLDYHVFTRIPNPHARTWMLRTNLMAMPGFIALGQGKLLFYAFVTCCNCTTLGIHQLGKHKRTHTIYLLPIIILATMCYNGSYHEQQNLVRVRARVGTNLAMKGIKDITTSHWFLCLLNCRATSLSNFCRTDICEIKWAGGQTEKSFRPLKSCFPFDSSKHQLFSPFLSHVELVISCYVFQCSQSPASPCLAASRWLFP